MRSLSVSAALGLAAFLLYAGLQARGEQEPPVRRAGLSEVFPAPGTVALRQAAVGADLAFGYAGRLTIDRRNIPDDQIDHIAGINRISFTPGAGKEIETLDEGRHCASLTYWRTSGGPESAGRPFTWCFTAA